MGRGIPGGGYQACDETMTEIRKAAQQMVREAFATDCEVLREWKQAHTVITDLLLQKDTVTGSEIVNIMATHPAVPVQDSAEYQVPLEQRAFQWRPQQGRLAYNRAVSA